MPVNPPKSHAAYMRGWRCGKRGLTPKEDGLAYLAGHGVGLRRFEAADRLRVLASLAYRRGYSAGRRARGKAG